MDKISVIVPIYKVEKYLRECVDSIIGETKSDFELILVDDGSPDNCGKICDEYAEKDKRITVIHKKNGGLISAWKAGVRGADGNYLMFVDGDDWVERSFVDEAMKIIAGIGDNVDLVQFEFCNKNALYDRSYRETDVQRIYPIMMYYKGYSKVVANSRCAKLFKKDIMLSILDDIDDSIEIGEDKLTTFTYLLRCKKVAFYNYKCYYQRMNYDSMTNRYAEALYEKTNRLFNNIKINIGKYKVEFDFSEQIFKEKAMYATAILANEYKLDDKAKLRATFDLLLKDKEVTEGVRIIDVYQLNYYCRNAIIALKNNSFRKLRILLFMKKIKNNVVRSFGLRKTR